MSRVQLFCASLLLISAAGYAEPPKSQGVAATLALPYSTVLPGVPFEIRVSLKNESKSKAVVGLVAQIIVTLPDGRRFTPLDRQMLEPQISTNADSANTWVELSPGESRDMGIGWSVPANWAQYEDYSGPGSYGIALRLDAKEPPANYVGSLVTNVAQLERIEPIGEDRLLWRRMVSLSHGHWSDNAFVRLKEGAALAQEIIATHPTSQYYPYALILRTRYDLFDEMERSREAAVRFAESPAHSYLLMHAAASALGKALTAEQWVHDPEASAKYNALAQSYFDDVLKSTSSPFLVDKAHKSKEILANAAGRSEASKK
jgi:hypothetical protein